jgi:hypothetical protein
MPRIVRTSQAGFGARRAGFGFLREDSFGLVVIDDGHLKGALALRRGVQEFGPSLGCLPLQAIFVVQPAEREHRLDEPEEFGITRIEGAALIPMRKIPANLQQLEAKADETTLVVFCHHGVRSLNVMHWLPPGDVR